MDYKNVRIPPPSATGRKTIPPEGSPGKKRDIPNNPVSACPPSVPAAPSSPDNISSVSEVEVPPPPTSSNQTLRIGTRSKPSGVDNAAVMRPRQGDKYRYNKMIGRGGMKVILQVFDNDTMRDVAMALLPDISTRSKLELGRFLREARITASLEHPNIVPVHDIGLDSAGSPYFTMKLLKGETLGTVLKKLEQNDPEYEKRYPIKTLLQIYTKICRAIAFAHSKGIVHLDLKPENVQLGDYGEVLVLDWGLARRIHVPDNKTSADKVLPKTQKVRKYTPDGELEEESDQADGTPGYMAPEQISSSQYSCSCQTDIYALGAILYTIITYKNPLQSTTVTDMLRDTLRGNIIRPSLRTENREIPFGIEAVVLKAMSLNPKDRYSSVEELREEVTSFIGGFDTKAEKASVWKKGLLFIKRHKRAFIVGTLLLFMASQLLLFYMREAKRNVGVWIPVFTTDFQKPGFPVDLISFRDQYFKEDPNGWRKVTMEHGLRMKRDQWLYLKEPLPANIKVTSSILLPERKNHTGELEFLLLNHETGKPLYTCHLDRIGKAFDEILCAENFYAPQILAGTPGSLLKRKKLTLTVTFSGETVSLQINNNDPIAIHSRYLKKANQLSLALRIGFPGAQLLKTEVRHLVPPENTLPLYLGELLLQERLYDKAIQSFLRIEENRRKNLVAQEALAKAYRAAALHMEGSERTALLLGIKKRLASTYPKFDIKRLLEDDVCIAWKNRDYALAAVLLEQTFEYNPHTQVMEKILAMPHFPLSADVGNLLLRMIRRSKNLRTLDLSNYGLTSLRELSGMALISLDCSNNRLLDLSGVDSPVLQSLNCSNNRISSLEGLKKQALRYLDCSGNKITDFNSLKGTALVRLHTRGNSSRIQPDALKTMSLLRFGKY